MSENELFHLADTSSAGRCRLCGATGVDQRRGGSGPVPFGETQVWVFVKMESLEDGMF